MSFPGGESLAAHEGAGRAISTCLLAEAGEERIAVVTHRSVLKALLAEALGLGEPWFWKFHLDNASVTVLLHDAHPGFRPGQVERDGAFVGLRLRVGLVRASAGRRARRMGKAWL